MNGYEIMAENIKKMIDRERNTLTDEEIKYFESEIKVYNMLSKTTEEEKYHMFNSGMFNDITCGYAKMAVDILSKNIKNKDEQEQMNKYGAAFVKTFRDLFNIHSAEEAEFYYKKMS